MLRFENRLMLCSEVHVRWRFWCLRVVQQQLTMSLETAQDRRDKKAARKAAAVETSGAAKGDFAATTATKEEDTQSPRTGRPRSWLARDVPCSPTAPDLRGFHRFSLVSCRGFWEARFVHRQAKARSYLGERAWHPVSRLVAAEP